jgi:hypothetical protein
MEVMGTASRYKQNDNSDDNCSVSFIESEDNLKSLDENIEKERVANIATAESKTIFHLKIFVLGFLIATAIGVACAVYYYAKAADDYATIEDYEEYTHKLIQSFTLSLDLSLGAVDNFVVNLVSYAKATNAEWPFVTLPDYAVKIAKIHAVSKVVQFSQCHFVTADQRRDWETYTSLFSDWV